MPSKDRTVRTVRTVGVGGSAGDNLFNLLFTASILLCYQRVKIYCMEREYKH